MTDYSLSSAGQLSQRLEQLETQLGSLQNDYEQTAANYSRLKWKFKEAMAQARLDQTGTVQEREDKALLSLAKAKNGDYREHIVAEADYNAVKLAVEGRHERASILQSLLKVER